MSLIPIDYVFLAVVIIFVIVALFKGLIEELFSRLSWVLGLICAILFYAKLADAFHTTIESTIICNILGFLCIFIGVFVIVKVIGLILKKIVSFPVLKSLDKALGLMFGVVEGLAVVGFIIFLLNLQPFFDASKFLNGSFFYGIINKFLSSPEFRGLTSNV